jgi:glycerophosphoryl diester phosphodiesterase
MQKLILLLLVLFSSITWGQNVPQNVPHNLPLILSHRGASYWAPEETKPSYMLATELHGDFWEMDIQRTSDKVLVAIHDLSPERTSNVAQVFPGRGKDPISKFTWGELQKLDFGSWFNKSFPKRARATYEGAKILSLDQIIDLVDQVHYKGGLYIESKNAELYPGMEDQIISLLQKKGWLDKSLKPMRPLYFQSFRFESIKKFKEKAPLVNRDFLIEGTSREEGMKYVSQAQETDSVLGPSEKMFLNPFLGVALLHSKVGLHVWTIDSSFQLRVMKALGVDGVFTNHTERAYAIFHGTKEADVGQSLKAIGY